MKKIDGEDLPGDERSVREEISSPEKSLDCPYDYKELRQQNTKASRKGVLEMGRTLNKSKRRRRADYGYCRRSLENFKALHRVLSKHGAEHLIEEVEISKLQLFYEILNEENIRAVIKFCSENSQRKLAEMARKFPLLTLLNEKKRMKQAKP